MILSSHHLKIENQLHGYFLVSTYIAHSLLGTSEDIRNVHELFERYKFDVKTAELWPFVIGQFSLLKSYEMLNFFDYKADNPKSTALGTAQWLIGIWNSVAPQGADRLDYRLSISLFIEYFPSNPKWWSECL